MAKEIDDLKFIKEKYGEDLSHICRTLFPTILEQPGKLSEILSSTFAFSKSIAKDYESNPDFANEFKNIIYKKFHNKEEKVDETILSAKELFKQAGYTLYPECQTEADIQSFRHFYYRSDGKKIKYTGGSPEPYLMPEELCTFGGDRLKSCRIWFAVKDGAEKLKREDFKKPIRQDEYGTSVISIQFTRGKNSVLSIKNRYNHSVGNPDATFSNNLDNIAQGLTSAMINEFGIDLSQNSQKFEFQDYVLANDGKYYRYNIEINNIYYCENNIIIKNFEPEQLDKSKYILCDYFIIDRSKNCTVKLYDDRIQDSFIDGFKDIESIQVEKEKDSNNQIIVFKVKNGGDIKLTINQNNQIVAYDNNNITYCSENFLYYNETLTKLNLPKLEKCGNYFLDRNKVLSKLNLPNLKQCGNYFLKQNKVLSKLDLPNLKQCGNFSLKQNKVLTELNLPNLEQCGDYFLCYNKTLTELNLPKLEQCGDYFLCSSTSLKELNLPNLIRCGDGFLDTNKKFRNFQPIVVKKF